jgi:hypothetical protein
MTDELLEGDDAIAEARRLIVEAARVYYDGFEHTRGHVVTGVVFIMEARSLDGGSTINYLCGNGAEPTGQDVNGISAWHLDGLLRATMREIDYRDRRFRIEAGYDDDD